MKGKTKMLKLQDISNHIPKKNNMLIYWLGGGGFVFKFSDKTTICIDPYLSNSVERLFGFKRLIQPPITPEALKFDALLVTHEHGDHLDIDIFETLVAQNPKSKIFAPKSCKDFIDGYTSNYIIVEPGKTYDAGMIKIEPVSADHGELSPDAVGFMLYFANRKIYFTGDTSLNYEKMDYAISLKPDILMPCINGAYGNMNEMEAAVLAKKCNSKIVIPSHYGLFKEHGGNAELFRDNILKISPDSNCIILGLGEGEES